MAWAEPHHARYRVRYRYAGRLVTDGTYDTAEAAQARVQRLDHLNRAVKLRIGAPPPTLTEWTTTWLPAHLAGTATLAKYESMLHCHILPAFGGHRLDAISRNDVKAFARTLTNDLAPVTVRSIISVLGLVLREAVRAWLTPWLLLQRCWTAWTNKPPPRELQQLLNAVGNGHALNLYLPP